MVNVHRIFNSIWGNIYQSTKRCSSFNYVRSEVSHIQYLHDFGEDIVKTQIE